MTAQNSKDGFEKLLARGLHQGLDRSAVACPDADTLAAYFERSLADAETRQWELHFSACARCQQQLAALARSEPAPEATAPAPFRLLNWRWLAPLATAAAVALLWIALRPPQPWAPPDAVQPETPAVATQAPPFEKEKAAEPETKEEPASRAATRAAAPAPAGPKLAASQAPAKPPMAETAALDKQARRSEGPRAADAVGALRDQAAMESKAQERIDLKAEPKRQNAAEALKTAQVPAAEPAQQKADAARPAATPVDESRGAAGKTGEQDAFAKTKRESSANEGFRDRQTVGLMALRAGEPRFASPDGKIQWRMAGSDLQKSTDAGKTWTTALTTEQPLTAGACASEKVCWAVGRSGLVMRTTDGEKWERVSEPASIDLVAVQVSGDASALVIAADGKRYRTTDAGKSWKLE